jgi:hypothetical protein
MNPESVRETYYFYTGKASEINRQLIFAGIALIWIFKTENSNHIALPLDLLLPAKVFIVALVLDILQYIISGIIYGIANRYYEFKNIPENTDFTMPVWFNWPGLLLFYGKLLANLCAYYYLYQYVMKAINFK